MFLACGFERDFITRIGVAHYAGRRIVPQHALEFSPCILRSVGDNHDARMLRIAHANATAMMEGDPARA